MDPQPLSPALLISQNACCGNGCRNCPYRNSQGQKNIKGTTQLAPEWQRWILFDFDGTLADTLELQLSAYQELQKKYGWKELTRQDLTTLREKPLRQAIREQGISLWRLPRFLAEGRDLLQKRWHTVVLYPEWGEVLAQLKESGYKLGIVTSNTRVVVENILERTQTRKYFQVIESEPQLWGKGRRLKKLVHERRWNPHHVWYVGDEIRDIEAARQASVNMVAVAWGLNTPESLQAQNVPLLHTPKDLIHWMHLHGKIRETP